MRPPCVISKTAAASLSRIWNAAKSGVSAVKPVVNKATDAMLKFHTPVMTPKGPMTPYQQWTGTTKVGPSSIPRLIMGMGTRPGKVLATGLGAAAAGTGLYAAGDAASRANDSAAAMIVKETGLPVSPARVAEHLPMFALRSLNITNPVNRAMGRVYLDELLRTLKEQPVFKDYTQPHKALTLPNVVGDTIPRAAMTGAGSVFAPTQGDTGKRLAAALMHSNKDDFKNSAIFKTLVDVWNDRKEIAGEAVDDAKDAWKSPEAQARVQTGGRIVGSAAAMKAQEIALAKIKAAARKKAQQAVFDIIRRQGEAQPAP